MRERASQAEYDKEQYSFVKPDNSSTSKKRLDLNDLLKRAKEQKERDKKLNLLIYAGAVFVIVFFVLIFSI